MSPTVKRFPAVRTSYWVLALAGSLGGSALATCCPSNQQLINMCDSHTYLSILNAEAEAQDDSFIIMLPDYADHHLAEAEAEAEPEQLLPESGID